MNPEFIIDEQQEIAQQKKVIDELQKKIDELAKHVKYIENQSDSKERAIVALARDKERLVTELQKERRSNGHLKQQLEDERNYYMKEKETYCKEMNEYKRHKRKLLLNNKIKEDNIQLKADLEEVLETNYNLCIKFLRMKHTKDDLKKRFERYQSEHATMLDDLATKLNSARNELDLIISEKFQQEVSLNQKKILQIVTRNSHLTHENLSLRLQLQHAVHKLDHVRNSQLKLKYPTSKKTSKNINNKEHSCGDSVKIDSKLVNNLNEPPTQICATYSGLYLPQISGSLGICSRTQSCPAILNFKCFSQIKTMSTQT